MADLRLFRIPEVAERLGIHKQTAWQMIWRGDLPVVRFGRSVRVSADDLKRWIDEHRDAA